MSKLRIVGYLLVIIGLIVEAVYAAKLGMRRGEVEDQLRVVIPDSEKAIELNLKSKSELSESRQLLANAKLGWGYEWTFPAGGNVGSVQVVGGRLAVTGLGTSNGLVPVLIEDPANNNAARPGQPVVHVFALNGQGGSSYIGEFVAGIGPNELSEQNATLIPIWNVTPQEMATWDFSGGVRMRSQIPAGGRSATGNLHQTIQRTYEQLTQTALRLEEQKRLSDAADAALTVRRNELLGDPNGPDNADHPEYKVGLVQALQDLEEERNAVQVAVDQLRRLIKTAAEFRQQQVDSLKQIVSSVEKSETRLSQSAE